MINQGNHALHCLLSEAIIINHISTSNTHERMSWGTATCTTWHVRQPKIQINLHVHSVCQILSCPYEESWGPWLLKECLAKIRVFARRTYEFVPIAVPGSYIYAVIQ